MTTPRIITAGRVGVDLYPLQLGVGLEDVTSFGKFLGGSPANVAVAAARLGNSVGLISGVGDDPFGKYLLAELARLGVDTAQVQTDSRYATPITFCEIFAPESFPLYFYRQPSAPDLQIRSEALDVQAIKDTDIFWFTTTGLSEEPSRQTHFDALTARGKQQASDGKFTILDLDYRPMFWEDPLEARAQVQRALEYTNVAVGNQEECEVAVGETEPERAADALLERGCDIAIVKQGSKGVLGKTRTHRVVVPPTPVDVVNGLGAGDSFGGSLCNGLLHGLDLAEILANANAAGAIVASRLECSTAMPTAAEIEQAVKTGSVPRRANEVGGNA